MAVLFDLDGTLLDTALDFVAVTNKMLQEQKKNLISYEDIKPLVSWGSKSIIENIFKISPNNPKFNSLVELFLKYYQENNHTLTAPFPGIQELLTKLEQENITWGIVTNKLGYLTNHLLKIKGLYNKAKCIVSGDTTKTAKPSQEPLIYASKLIDTDPRDCIYIGDAKHDIIAGNAAGMYTISALYGYIKEYADALEWPAKNRVTEVQEIFPLVYQWHKQKRSKT